MKKPNFSVVIVTRDRQRSLLLCLSSILSQSYKPKEIVVIDNMSRDETRDTLAHIKDTIKIPLHYIKERKKGYPAIYNSGLKNSREEYTIFLDDDCIASKNWLLNYALEIKKKPSDVFLGHTRTYHDMNVFSLVTLFFYELWQSRGRSKTQIHDFSTLDNKNICYKRSFLHASKISFDESRRKVLLGLAEDCDFGLQIAAAGGRATYVKGALAWHQDPVTWATYWRKFISSHVGFNTVKQKWDSHKQYMTQNKNVKILPFLLNFFKEYNVSDAMRVKMLFLVSLSIGMNKAFWAWDMLDRYLGKIGNKFFETHSL